MRSGQVRCGRCNAVFDGLAHLAQELDRGAPPGEERPAAPVEAGADSAPPVSVTSGQEEQAPETMPSPAPAAPEFHADEEAQARRSWKDNDWLIVTASALLAVLLAGQLAFRDRDELAASYPALRPLFVAMCAVFGCELGLPRRADRLSIEGDEMIAADPREPSRVTLIATLRNGAPFAVAYPHLELSLQNDREQVLARRTLGPGDYLERGTEVPQGLAAQGELNLRLALDTGTVRADGYRLLVFYPRSP